MRECADDYGRVVLRLNANWRIIVCREGCQWILQRRGSPERARKDDWRGRSYCRTLEALIRCTREHTGGNDSSAASVLAELPPHIEVSSGDVLHTESESHE
jgi:hypothetical protein